MATEVEGYQKRMKTGQLVQVKDYRRDTNTAAAEAVAAHPGRPPMAATVGQFAAGRSIPGVWLDTEQGHEQFTPDYVKKTKSIKKVEEMK